MNYWKQTAILSFTLINSLITPAQHPTNDQIIFLFEHSALKAQQNLSITAKPSLSALLKWATRNNKLQSCIYWFETQSHRYPNNNHLKTALSDAYFLNQNWEQLIELNKTFPPNQQDFMCMMHMSFAARQLKNKEWMAYWTKSRNLARNNTIKTKTLIHFLSKWKWWDKEIESLLWEQIDNETELFRSATNGLINLYNLQSNIEGLLRVNKVLLSKEPHNENLLSNHLLLCIYSNSKVSEDLITYFQNQQKDGIDKQKLIYAVYLTSSKKIKAAKKTLNSISNSFLFDKNNAAYSAYIFSYYDVKRAKKYMKIAEKGHYPSYEKEFLLKNLLDQTKQPNSLFLSPKKGNKSQT